MKLRLSLMAMALSVPVALSYGQGNTFTIDLKKPCAPVQSTMYGIFFEDINFGADGGLYAELVKNRSFEFPQAMQGWKSFGKVEVKEDGPFTRCPHYVRLHDPGHHEKRTGIENEGFFGMGIKEGGQYKLSFWARVPDGCKSEVKAEILDPCSQDSPQSFSTCDISVNGDGWKRYESVLISGRTCSKASLRLTLKAPATIDIEHISLIPTDAVEGVFRKDLVEALADLRPGVFRFPGGCIVEGTTLADRYQWKNTVGPAENRPLNPNRWQYTFPHRLYPDYYQSFGLGFYEYFLLSEIIGASPLPILNCGLACQYQNHTADAHVPVDGLQPYVQDALDLIEFANGPEESGWGRIRSEMGHPAPFGLKFIGIGNEQWDTLYTQRLQPFVDAISKAYPEISIVGSAGPSPDGEKFDFLWPEMKKIGADLVDEHYYKPESWFLSNATRYDSYDRKGPKVFAGEYACHAKGYNRNHFYAALAEAAFMTGLERNADIVHMATYAPLFAHVDGWQWRPDLIWFDNLRSVRSASWQVQSLYGRYKGKNVLRLSENGRPVAGLDGQNGLYASAVSDGNLVYVKIVNASDKPQDISVNFSGLKKKESFCGIMRTDFTSDDLRAENTLDSPLQIVPSEEEFRFEGQGFELTVKPYCFTIVTCTR